MMRIGIDIDDTITETKNEISKQIKKFRHLYKLEKYNEYHQLSDENFQKFIVEFGKKIYLGMKIKKRAIETIQNWHQEGHEIYLITARAEKDCPNVEQYTKAFLKKWEIPYDHIVFNSSNKGEDIKPFYLDVFIEI